MPESREQYLKAELEQLAHAISHDLRAPLRAISSLAQWLHEDHGQSLDDDGREMLLLMRDRTLRANAMIEGLVAYSRIGQDLPNAAVDLNDVVQRAAEQTVSDGRSMDIAPLPTVYGHHGRLRELFAILLDNAAKHGYREDLHVSVSGIPRPHEWEIHVADNGAGIAARDLERVFALFQTGKPMDEAPGIGVGLALAKRIVDMHGGRIRAESSAEGAVIIVTLPLPIQDQGDA